MGKEIVKISQEKIVAKSAIDEKAVEALLESMQVGNAPKGILYGKSDDHGNVLWIASSDGKIIDKPKVVRLDNSKVAFLVTKEAEVPSITPGHLETLSIGQLQSLIDDATRVKKEKERLEVETRFLDLANKVLGDVEGAVTPRRLTEFFTKKAKAAEPKRDKAGNVLERGEVLTEEAKNDLVELVRAFRECGGKVKFEGQACTIDLRKRSRMKQYGFHLRTADKDQKPIKSSVRVPKLTFSK